jgi:hypothetical protein
VTLFVGALLGLHPTGWLLAIVMAYLVWGVVGGTIVRPRGNWWEIALVAAVLVGLLLLVDMAAYLVADLSGRLQPGDDNAIGVGMAFLVVIVYPPTMALVALGRLFARAISAVRSRA